MEYHEKQKETDKEKKKENTRESETYRKRERDNKRKVMEKSNFFIFIFFKDKHQNKANLFLKNLIHFSIFFFDYDEF